MGIQFPQAEVVAGRLQYCLQRRQADELGRFYGGAEAGCRRTNGFQGNRDGGLFEVGQVHRDLSLPPTPKPSALTAGRPPPLSLTRLATVRATSTSSVSRYALKATRKGRAPTATAPLWGSSVFGP